MTAIYRRNFITGASAVALGWTSSAWAAVPAERSLAFNVFRKGSRIGTHSLEFSQAGEALTVRVAVDFAVGLGPITLYRYRLRGTEEWSRGVLMSGNFDTVDGGETCWLRAARVDGRLAVQGSAVKPYAAPEASLISSHWNAEELRAPMVNMQNGELLDFKITPRGSETIRTGGRDVAARHYALSGPAELNLWYDPTNIWTKLRGVGTDGSEITYERA